jgi:hypothetical protein
MINVTAKASKGYIEIGHRWIGQHSIPLYKPMSYQGQLSTLTNGQRTAVWLGVQELPLWPLMRWLIIQFCVTHGHPHSKYRKRNVRMP